MRTSMREGSQTTFVGRKGCAPNPPVPKTLVRNHAINCLAVIKRPKDYGLTRVEPSCHSKILVNVLSTASQAPDDIFKPLKHC
jgi:hypothetical protein